MPASCNKTGGTRAPGDFLPRPNTNIGLALAMVKSGEALIRSRGLDT